MAEPLDRAAIQANLAALGDRLAANGLQARLLVVGGSYLALNGLRDSTIDVDTVTRLDAEVKAAIEAVAAERGLDPSWLNDRAAAFAPSTSPGESELLFAHGSLVVLGPSPDFVFLSKVERGKQRDFDDLVVLWPRTSFGTPQAAVDAFYLAYPRIDPDTDPHLVGYIERVAARAAAGDGQGPR